MQVTAESRERAGTEMKLAWIVAISAPVTFACCPAAAEEEAGTKDSEPPPTFELPAVTVVGEPRTLASFLSANERDPGEVFDLPYTLEPVEGVGESALRAPRSLVDALGSVHQIHTQKTAPGQGSPTVRGFTGFRTLTLVDGIRLNNTVWRDGPNQYTQLVEPLMLDRAEVAFGPSSVQYGSDAIGGALSLVTHTPRRTEGGVRTGGRLYGRYASAEDSLSGRAEGEVATQRAAAYLGGTLRNFGDLSGGRHQGRFEDTGFDEDSSDGKLVVALDERLDAILAYQRHAQDEVPRTHSTVFAQSYRGTSLGTDLARDTTLYRELVYGKVRNRRDTDPVRGDWTVYRYVLDEREDRTLSTSRKRIQGFTDEMLGTSLFVDAPSFARGRLSCGADYSFESVNSDFREYNPDGSLREQRTRGPVADDSSYQMAGVFIENRSPIAPRTELVAGGRYTFVRADADEVDPIPSDADVFTSVSDEYSALVGNLRAIYNVRDDLNVYVGAAQGFRAPNLSDLTRFDVSRSGEVEIPATDLDPEHYLTLELGTKLEHDALECHLAGYYTFVDGMIVRFPTVATDGAGNPIVTKDNIGDGHIVGVEASAVVPVTETLSVFGAFAWMEGRIDDFKSLTVKDEVPLTRTQPTSALCGVRFEPMESRFRAEAEVRIADNEDRLSPSDERDTQRIPPGGTPGYTTFALRGTWEARDGFHLFANLENITDRDYRIHGSGTNEPGTNVVLGFDWRF